MDLIGRSPLHTDAESWDVLLAVCAYCVWAHTVSGLESLLHRPKSFGTFRFSKVPNVFRVPEFQYLENEGFSRHITSPLLYFLFLLQHLKRPGFQNKQVEVAWMAFRGQTAFGTLEKRVPDGWTQANLICNSCIGNELLWGPVCKWVVPSPARPWGSGYHLVVPWIIDQFRYIIIQLKTINMTPRLQEIKKGLYEFFPGASRWCLSSKGEF